MNTRKSMSTQEILESYIISTNDCWLTKLKPKKDGYVYGHIKLKELPLHRVAYEVYKDKISENMWVSHSCKNKACVNPEHLFLTKINGSAKEKLEQHIISKDGCWITDLFIKKNGYPSIKINGKIKRCNRLSYEIYIGEIPKEMVVCHTCDNKACVNPEHLFIGTQKDNIYDMIKKGRQNQPKGSKHPNAKLTEEQVLKIKELLAKGIEIKEIAKLYKVTVQNIDIIRKNKSWKHLKIENAPTYNIVNSSVTINNPISNSNCENCENFKPKQLDFLDKLI